MPPFAIKKKFSFYGLICIYAYFVYTHRTCVYFYTIFFALYKYFADVGEFSVIVCKFFCPFLLPLTSFFNFFHKLCSLFNVLSCNSFTFLFLFVLLEFLCKLNNVIQLIFCYLRLYVCMLCTLFSSKVLLCTFFTCIFYIFV